MCYVLVLLLSCQLCRWLFHIHLFYNVFVTLRNEYTCMYPFLFTVYDAQWSFACLAKQTMNLDLRILLLLNFIVHSVVLHCQNRWSVLVQYKIILGIPPANHTYGITCMWKLLGIYFRKNWNKRYLIHEMPM